MKILNLYGGIGGNRKLWGETHHITTVEMNEEIATVYKKIFPDDILIVGDAHQYLLENFEKFDLIWASPPCQTHSSFRQNIGVRYRGVKPVYPDMKLYQEIIFLQNNFKGLFVVENVKPYYKPLIEPSFQLDRHNFWSNFDVEKIEFSRPKLRATQIPELQEFLGYDLSDFKISNKRQVLRNCVNPQVGEHILKFALLEHNKKADLAESTNK
ncbi:MAG: DNA cytosine methyltransferase [Streptococcaceae bacterium]|jgi:DNA (cytosine-5)-methyltransferase 1|nr:DNA cytosine methyltransferase [Streptococcaceae bacterium]MCH4176221.1 DNA cytosine methyltransferase [Streptococcaceae bacterium]